MMEISKTIIRRYSVPVSTVYEDNKLMGEITNCEIERTTEGDKIVITTTEQEGD